MFLMKKHLVKANECQLINIEDMKLKEKIVIIRDNPERGYKKGDVLSLFMKRGDEDSVFLSSESEIFLNSETEIFMVDNNDCILLEGNEVKKEIELLPINHKTIVKGAEYVLLKGLKDGLLKAGTIVIATHEEPYQYAHKFYCPEKNIYFYIRYEDIEEIAS